MPEEVDTAKLLRLLGTDPYSAPTRSVASSARLLVMKFVSFQMAIWGFRGITNGHVVAQRNSAMCRGIAVVR